jgi:hypothetical protein
MAAGLAGGRAVTKRIKLQRAASRLGSDLWGAPWRRLHSKVVVEGKLTDPAERERWAAFYVALQDEVLGRLRSSEWVAWGCWQAGARPAEIPRELWERDDVELDLLQNRVDWAAGNFIDQLTVLEGSARARAHESIESDDRVRIRRMGESPAPVAQQG